LILAAATFSIPNSVFAIITSLAPNLNMLEAEITLLGYERACRV